MPPSSDPIAIFWELTHAIERDDGHASRIAQNRAGLVKGADSFRSRSLLADADYDEIVALVDRCPLSGFRPLLFVIPYSAVRNLVRVVPATERAHLLGMEYIIEALPRDAFDVLDLGLGK